MLITGIIVVYILFSLGMAILTMRHESTTFKNFVIGFVYGLTVPLWVGTGLIYNALNMFVEWLDNQVD